jgi:hypothetical protein
MPSLPSPSRRALTRHHSRASRNLAIADAAYAFLRDRIAAQSSRLPHRKSKSSNRNKILAGGAALLAVAVAAGGAVFARSRRGGDGAGPPSPTDVTPTADAFPPQPSNYDAAGPVANTATPIPAPDGRGLYAIDEEAEEAAAAAEAAAIGGEAPDYSGLEADLPAEEAARPLAEAGEGEAEGQEQAEAALRDAAEPADGPSPYERQIDEAIEAQDEPASGETPEPLASAPEPSPEGDAEERS